MAGELFEIDRHLGRERHVEKIPRLIPIARLDLQHIRAAANHSLAEQKPRGEFFIMPRRSHRDAYRAAANAELQRLLGRELIRCLLSLSLEVAEDFRWFR